ncbi:MAG: hypothetical protein KDC31_02250 [Saprospiraceae bacterium]|nr:hypothetical protein [Saprospiraceae bacterium]MBX7178309.1 hypothetical protein [Saprospiraceae bacterium]MCB0590087.1 hypothetical protein [Saprospiraceae bacterium]MCO5284055.1 hypothetical protein [Saprospiraceae bacterium]MCO6470831.1 hypothetical protein [Saprospiraceae bacterium]
MGCNSCSTEDGKPKGCRSNGVCGTSGCNKLNTFDWLTTMELEDPTEVNLVEVSFRKGAHKSFFRLQDAYQAEIGDDVVVDADGGYDIGRISLKGALVPIQMKKKSVDPNSALRFVIRTASQNDMAKLEQAISMNRNTLIRSRAIAATLGLDMKIGDVDYRADLKKATFYYTADGRVDFRELIRHFAKEFRVKIEMRQIGSRQESSRIGGMGSCGRELCCSTWLTDFKSVTTNAARYQNLAINQAKLSGQCGRLKCCLNYELDVYMEALEDFPTNADVLRYQGGQARLIKTDIFKKLMFYIKKDEKGREAFITLRVDEVLRIQEDIAHGKLPEDITSTKVEAFEDDAVIKSEDLTGHIELPEEKRRKKKKKKNPENKPMRHEGQKQEDKKETGNEGKDNNQRRQDNRRNEHRDNRNKAGRPQQGRSDQPDKKPEPRDKGVDRPESIDRNQEKSNNQNKRNKKHRNQQRRSGNRPNNGNAAPPADA